VIWKREELVNTTDGNAKENQEYLLEMVDAEQRIIK